MKASKLQPGAMVETRFAGRLTQHQITERKEVGKRVLLRVFPPVPKTAGNWMGADHFRPVGAKSVSRKAKMIAFVAGALVALLLYLGVPQFLYGWAVLGIGCQGGTVLAQSCR